MKIKEFSIIRYGPLPNTGRFSLSNFNLFFGKNEDGKTLTIDALVKLLLGRDIKDFEKIDRVPENPEGYVIVEDDKNKELKLPESGYITKILGLTPSECRNIFIIRNSDLSIARESEFYTSVTDQLTGLRTAEIFKIKDVLEDIGKITPMGTFRDRKGEKLKTRIEDANNLILDIKVLLKKIKKEKLDELEKESIKLSDEIDKRREEMNNLEDARKREKYEIAKGALDTLKEALVKFEDLKIYNENVEQLWRGLERDIQNYYKEKRDYLEELRENQENLKEMTEKLSEEERNFQILKDRKQKLDGEVVPDVRSYEMEVGKAKSDEVKNRFYKRALTVSLTLLIIAFLGALINLSFILSLMCAFFLTSTIFFAVLSFSFTQREAHLKAVFARIKLAISRFGFNVESPEEIYLNIQKFDEEYKKEENKLHEMQITKEGLGKEMSKLRDKSIRDLDSKIKGAEEKIDEIKIKSKLMPLEEYNDKLRERRGLEKLIDGQKGILKSYLVGDPNNKREEPVSYWEKEIKDLEEFRDKGLEVKYSEATASKLDKKKQKLEKDLEEANNTMKSIRKEMEGIERESNEILQSGESKEYLYCRTSIDLEAVKDKLQDFVKENENTKNNALEVKNIFEVLEKEEREKVAELFGKKSPVSKYFNEITDGLYEEVTLNKETSKIEVLRRDGKTLEAEKLSGGTYDQLYLSIRRVLGEKLLKDRKGFFIMDDPFIKSSLERLQRQVLMLKMISELGWQIIYFSAKGEIKDALEEDIKKGTINFIELQGIFP